MGVVAEKGLGWGINNLYNYKMTKTFIFSMNKDRNFNPHRSSSLNKRRKHERVLLKVGGLRICICICDRCKHCVLFNYIFILPELDNQIWHYFDSKRQAAEEVKSSVYVQFCCATLIT